MKLVLIYSQDTLINKLIGIDFDVEIIEELQRKYKDVKVKIYDLQNEREYKIY